MTFCFKYKIHTLCTGQMNEAGTLQLQQGCRYHSWGINLTLFLWLWLHRKNDMSVCSQCSPLQHLMSCCQSFMLLNLHTSITFKVHLNHPIFSSYKTCEMVCCRFVVINKNTTLFNWILLFNCAIQLFK